MRGLTRRPVADSERGSVATIVAVMLSGMVIIGMLAVSVDLGNLTYERRQVQNAADATSLALAQECASDPDDCDPELVEDLLDANSRDDASRYDSRADAPDGACARGDVTQVGPLAAVQCVSSGDITDLGECPAVPDWLADNPGIPYVETYSATETGSGGTELFLPFSRVLAGGESGDKGTSACARAAWGPLSSVKATLPISIGKCEWDTMTASAGDYAPGPPYTPSGSTTAKPPVPGVIDAGDYASAIFTHDSGDHKCVPSPGHAYPGGFGWLPNVDCAADITIGWNTGGAGDSEACGRTELAKYLGKEVVVPIYDQVSGSGSGGQFHVVGFASFYMVGWHSLGKGSGSKTQSIYAAPTDLCTGKCNDSVSYVWGWFTSTATTDGSIGSGGEDLGVTVIKPAG